MGARDRSGPSGYSNKPMFITSVEQNQPNKHHQFDLRSVHMYKGSLKNSTKQFVFGQRGE